MLGFFKKRTHGSVITLQVVGMHCTSCALSIDGELEDLPGVFAAHTNYAQATTVVEYDATQLSIEQLLAAVARAGYEATPA